MIDKQKQSEVGIMLFLLMHDDHGFSGLKLIQTGEEMMRDELSHKRRTLEWLAEAQSLW